MFKKTAWALVFVVVASVASVTSVAGIDPVFAATSVASPVVQVISYTDVYGKYPLALGWGSASVISSDGILLTNNHVVDDGAWRLATAFNVCVTQVVGQKPVCDYTASLIQRDETLDLALLKIDPTDIHGNRVDFAMFPVLAIDYTYVPKTQDDVVATGYPWIGAETITETKGIIGGTVQYNDNTYIKTDTVIAGWNSGGPLLYDNKIIGVNTYGIGGFYEPSLGYALSISEGQAFIAKWLTAPVVPQKILVDFANYRKTIDTINAAKQIKDTVFTFSFPETYELRNYVANKRLELVPRQNKEISVSQMNAYLLKTPVLANEKHYWWYMQSAGYWNKDWQKLIKKQIDGRTFYQPVAQGDVTAWWSDWRQLYITQLSPTVSVIVEVMANLGDEKNHTKVQQEMDRLLGWFHISPTGIASTAFSFDLVTPAFAITSSSGMSGMVLDDTMWKALLYLGDLTSYLTVNVAKKYLYTWKWRTAKEMYDAEMAQSQIDPANRRLFSWKWYKWYMFCNPSGPVWYMSWYGGFDMNAGALQQVANQQGEYIDENGNAYDPAWCTLRIVEGVKDANNEEYTIDIALSSRRSRLEADIDATISLMQKYFDIDARGSGETTLTNILRDKVQVTYKDLVDQKDAWKEELALLLKYKLLRAGEWFRPYEPARWDEFLPFYLRSVYNIRPNDTGILSSPELGTLWLRMDDLYKQMWVTPATYVPYDRLSVFQIFLQAKLAWVALDDWSEEWLMHFDVNKKGKTYQSQYQKLNEFEHKVYGSKKVLIWEFMQWAGDGYFFAKYQPYETAGGWKLYQQFRKKSSATFLSQRACMAQRAGCVQAPDSEDLLMSRGQMIDIVVPQIDFSLFDPELREKKEIRIEG